MITETSERITPANLSALLRRTADAIDQGKIAVLKAQFETNPMYNPLLLKAGEITDPIASGCEWSQAMLVLMEYKNTPPIAAEPVARRA